MVGPRCIQAIRLLHHHALDIADDADGGGVFAGDVVAGHFDDIDHLGIQEFGTGFGTDAVEADIAEPVAEEQGGVATVVDKHRAIGLTVLRFDDQQEIVVFVFQNLVHILIGS